MRFAKIAVVLVTGGMMLNVLGCNPGAVLAGVAEDQVVAAAEGAIDAAEDTVQGLNPVLAEDGLLGGAVMDWFDTVGDAVVLFVANQIPGN